MFNINLDDIYKYNRFSKVFLKKSFEIILYKRNNLVKFKSSIILLLIEANFILEKQSFKKEAYVASGLIRFKIVFALSIEIESLYIQVFKI